MSFEVVCYYDGVGEVPSTIVGGSPNITATLTSYRFIDQLANAGIHARVVSDEALPPSRFVPDPEGVEPTTFPGEATRLTISGYRPIGRFALEIVPPLEGSKQTFFEEILLRASGPIHRDHRKDGKEERLSTAELEQLVAESEAAEAVAS